MLTDIDWEWYYQQVAGRAPRQLIIDAVNSFNGETGRAIDLGCGDGTESLYLLEHGWEVLAVDGEPAAIKRLLEKTHAALQASLQTQVAKFPQVVLSPTDLIHASLSLPFCEPEYFDALWAKIAANIQPGGRFAGQLFGINDSWVVNQNMTFHTDAQVHKLFSNFQIESLEELDEDGQATSGPKHWHVFTVIAQKG